MSNLPNLDEPTLIRRSRAGDGDAFGELYRRHRAGIHRLIAARVGEREREDLVQEAFLKAYVGLGAFRGDAAFSTWLTRIAINVCASHGRRPPPAPVDPHTLEDYETLGPGHSFPSPEKEAERASCWDAVRKTIGRLPDSIRQAVWMRYHDDRSYRDISQRLGVPLGTVKTWIHRGKQHLRETLSQ